MIIARPPHRFNLRVIDRFTLRLGLHRSDHFPLVFDEPDQDRNADTEGEQETGGDHPDPEFGAGRGRPGEGETGKPGEEGGFHLYDAH